MEGYPLHSFCDIELMNHSFKSIFTLMTILVIGGCSSTVVPTPKGYETIYHVVDFKNGDVVVTSAFQSESRMEMTGTVDQSLDFVKLHSFKNDWANITFTVHKENSHCSSDYSALSANLTKTFYKGILKAENLDITINFMPLKNFLIEERFSPEDAYNFYYPVDFCDPAVFPRDAIYAAGKVVHEVFHIIAFHNKNMHISSEDEEERANILQFCNGVLSEYHVEFSEDYFSLDFELERSSIMANNFSRTYRDSAIGRLSAMEKVRNHLTSDVSDVDFCEKEVSRILVDI